MRSFIVALTGAVLLSAGASAAGPTVTLPDGTQLLGAQDGDIATFKGIPFAQPPLGALRFAPPQPYVNSNTSQPLDATKHGHLCTQLTWGDDGLFDKGSEDCLTLNVFVSAATLADPPSEQLPVAVFVHGGSYVNGGGSLPLYDGVDLLEYTEGRVVLVTINYRLNAFGFLGSDKLRVLDESGSTGNAGIQDQRMAFQWVADNIATFGGNSSRVTIFGESAGAGSVTNHITRPRSAGMFAGGIMESGAFGPWVATTMDCAEKMFDVVAATAGCGGDKRQDVVRCLQRASEERLLAGAGKAQFTSGCSWAPAVDGVEATTHPWISLSNGDVADVPLMLGTNADEGAIFTALRHQATEQELDEYWAANGYSEEEVAQMTSLYVTGRSYPDEEFATVNWWAAQRSVGDEWMTCPSENAARQLGQQQATGQRASNSYFYHFEHLPRSAPVTRHVSELQYAFHQEELTRFPADAAMADTMASYWLNFFERGDPNGQTMGRLTLPLWAPFDAAVDQVLAIVNATDVTPVSHMKEAECEFSINRVDTFIRAGYPVDVK